MALLRDGDEKVSLGEKFLTEVGSLIESPVGGVQSIVQAARDGADLPPEVFAFAANLVGEDALAAVLAALGQPVSELPADGLAWSWSREGAEALPAGELVLELGYDVGFGVRILPGPAVRVSGELGLSGCFMVPFQYGSFAFQAAGQGSAELGVHFVHENGALPLYRALIEDLPLATRLTDPRALLQASTFERFTLSTKGQIRLGGRLVAGRSFHVRRGEDGSTGGIRAIGELGASYNLDWSRGGEYQIDVEVEGEKLRISLRDQVSTQFKHSLSVGASIKIDGLEAVVTPVVNEYAALPEAVSKLVERWSRPTELLQQEIVDRLRAASGTLASLLTADDVQPLTHATIDELIARRLTAVVDERVEPWTELLGGRVERLCRRMLERVKDRLPAELERKAEEELEGLLESVSKSLREALTREISEVVGRLRSTEPVGSARRELAEITGAVGEVFEDLDREAARLLAPVVTFLERLRGVRQKLLDAVQSITREELGLRLMREVEAAEEHQTLLSLVLDPASHEARRLYGAMLTGDFHDAMRAGMDADAPYITLESGLLKDHLFHRSSTGFVLNLFGPAASSELVTSSDLQVEYSVDGTVSVFASRASLDRVRRWRAENQVVSFASSARLAASGVGGPRPFSVQVQIQDDDMQVNELREFMARLETAELVRAGATDGAMRSYDALGVPDSDGHRALRLDLVLPVSRAEFLRLTELPTETVQRAAVEVQVRLHRRLRRIRPFRWVESRLASGTVEQLILDQVGKSSGRVKRDLARLLEIPSDSFEFQDTHGGLTRLSALVYRIAKNAEGLADYLAGMSVLSRDMDQVRARPGQRLDSDVLGALESRHRELVRSLAGWSGTEFGIDLFKPERLSISTLAFLTTLSELGAGGGMLVPVVSWKESGQEQKILFG